MVLKTLENPLDYRRSNHSILKEINPGYSLESLEKTLILGKIEAKGGKDVAR